MCGLSFIVDKSLKSNFEKEIYKMNDSIIHRGPDDEGVYFYQNLSFGFRRLSILDLSDLGHQPMLDRNGNVLIFNGEIFNYIELKKQLSDLGCIFKTKTDTEVVLAAYEKWGAECIKKFNGMWGLVLFDKNKDRLLISRDRFGIKPLYYFNSQNIFSVASEIKQFYALSGFEPEQESESVYRYLLKSQLNTTSKTFFKNVFEVPQGCNFIYNLKDNSLKKYKYYDPQNIELNEKITLEEAADTFFKLFNQSIKIRLRTDVSLGSCLSGGLDSSSIVAFASSIRPQEKVKTISSCFNDKRFDEQEYIDRVLNDYNLEGIKIFPDINELFELDVLRKIIYFQDQPIKDTSHFAEYSVFEAAKKNSLTVMLDGQGADEFLAGYLPFPHFNQSLLRNGRLLSLFKNLYFQKKNHFSIKSLLFITAIHILKQLPMAENIRQIRQKSRNYWFEGAYKNFHLDDPCDEAVYDSFNRLSIKEIKYNRLPYQLHSEDRNSMMNSIEARLPFLDFDLADFMISLPDRMKLENGTTKLVLREAFQEILPAQILDRHGKMGFEAPEEPLFKKNRKVASSLISKSIDSSQMLDPIIIKEFDSYLNGERPYDNKFFRIISYQLWYENFMHGRLKNQTDKTKDLLL